MPTYDIELQAKVNSSFANALKRLTKAIQQLTETQKEANAQLKLAAKGRRENAQAAKTDASVQKNTHSVIKRIQQEESRAWKIRAAEGVAANSKIVAATKQRATEEEKAWRSRERQLVSDRSSSLKNKPKQMSAAWESYEKQVTASLTKANQAAKKHATETQRQSAAAAQAIARSSDQMRRGKLKHSRNVIAAGYRRHAYGERDISKEMGDLRKLASVERAVAGQKVKNSRNVIAWGYRRQAEENKTINKEMGDLRKYASVERAVAGQKIKNSRNVIAAGYRRQAEENKVINKEMSDLRKYASVERGVAGQKIKNSRNVIAAGYRRQAEENKTINKEMSDLRKYASVERGVAGQKIKNSRNVIAAGYRRQAEENKVINKEMSDLRKYASVERGVAGQKIKNSRNVIAAGYRRQAEENKVINKEMSDLRKYASVERAVAGQKIKNSRNVIAAGYRRQAEENKVINKEMSDLRKYASVERGVAGQKIKNSRNVIAAGYRRQAEENKVINKEMSDLRKYASVERAVAGQKIKNSRNVIAAGYRRQAEENKVINKEMSDLRKYASVERGVAGQKIKNSRNVIAWGYRRHAEENKAINKEMSDLRKYASVERAVVGQKIKNSRNVIAWGYRRHAEENKAINKEMSDLRKYASVERAVAGQKIKNSRNVISWGYRRQAEENKTISKEMADLKKLAAVEQAVAGQKIKNSRNVIAAGYRRQAAESKAINKEMADLKKQAAVERAVRAKQASAKRAMIASGKRLVAQIEREKRARERVAVAARRAAAANDRFSTSLMSAGGSAAIMHSRMLLLYYVVYRWGGALKRSVDTITSFQNQIRLSTVTSKQFQEVQVGLLKIGRETGNSVEYLSKIYQRFRNALQRYGVTSKQVLRITDTMAKTVSAFGLAIPEARGAMIQLSQGLAAGQLRGHELISVMEQLPPIAALIARELGGFTSDLRKWGKTGKITSEVVFRALERGAEMMDMKFKNFRFTVEKASTVLRDNFAVAAEAALDASGIKGGLVSAILALSDWFTKLSGVTDDAATKMQKAKAMGDFLAESLRWIARLIGVLINYQIGVWLGKLVYWLWQLKEASKEAGKALVIIKGALGGPGGIITMLFGASVAGLGWTLVNYQIDKFEKKLGGLAGKMKRVNAEADAVRGKTSEMLKEVQEFLKGVAEGRAKAADMVTIGLESKLRLAAIIEVERKAGADADQQKIQALQAVIKEVEVIEKKGHAIIKQNKEQKKLDKDAEMRKRRAAKDAENEKNRRIELGKLISRDHAFLLKKDTIEQRMVIRLARSQKGRIVSEREKRGDLTYGDKELKYSEQIIKAHEEEDKALQKKKQRLDEITSSLKRHAHMVTLTGTPGVTDKERLGFHSQIASDVRSAQLKYGDLSFREGERRFHQDIVDKAKAQEKAQKETERAAEEAARKIAQEMHKAASAARQAATVIGNSLVNAFSSVTQAAQLFGDKWANVANVIIRQVGQLIVKYIALQQAQAAASNIGGPAAAAQLAQAAGAANPAVAGTIAAVATISAVLSTLFSKESGGEKRQREAQDSEANERTRQELVAYEQRREMIELERRQTIAVEEANRKLDEQRIETERAIKQRDEALRRSFEFEHNRIFQGPQPNTPVIRPPEQPQRTPPIQIALVNNEDEADLVFSEKGRRAFLNLTDLNQDEVRKILGVA